MGKVICVSNQKGGVGKTTSAVNISASLAMSGVKVLVIDSDPQGNCTSGLGIDRNSLKSTLYDCINDKRNMESAITSTLIEGLSIIGSTAHLAASELELIDAEEREFVLKKLIDQISENFDIIIVDCPPSLGLLTINALAASELLLIPLQCEYYALEGLGQLISTMQLVKEKLNPSLEIAGVLMTMADFRTNLTQQVIAEVKSHFGDKVFGAVIPRSVRISEAPSFGKPLVLYDPSSKGSKAYQEVARELMGRLGIAGKPEEAVPEKKIELKSEIDSARENIEEELENNPAGEKTDNKLENHLAEEKIEAGSGESENIVETQSLEQEGVPHGA